MSDMSNEIELVSLPPSPYGVKAKWALDYHGVTYKFTKYTPGIGERWLRRKTGKKDGIVTIPVMFTPDGVLMDSFDIAQWADKHGKDNAGKKLFPDEQLQVISKWNRACDDVLEYGRAQIIDKLKADKGLRRQMMPPVLNSLGPLTDWLSSMMYAGIAAKYDELSKASSFAKVSAAFEQLRKAISSNNGYILGSFTYADIAMAVACDRIEPLGPPYYEAPEVMRLPNAELKEKFADLLQYRDRIFKEHFPNKISQIP